MCHEFLLVLHFFTLSRARIPTVVFTGEKNCACNWISLKNESLTFMMRIATQTTPHLHFWQAQPAPLLQADNNKAVLRAIEICDEVP